MRKTQDNILNATENLIQLKGFNGFSYKDISNLIGIKTSSIHYHFPTKEDLVIAVIDWQMNKLCLKLTKLLHINKLSPKEKLYRLVEYIFQITYKNNFKMCLGGMLATDIFSFSNKLKNKVQWFFAELIKWVNKITDNLNQNINNVFAEQLITHLEGSLLLARLHEDKNYLSLVKLFIDQQIE